MGKKKKSQFSGNTKIPFWPTIKINGCNFCISNHQLKSRILQKIRSMWSVCFILMSFSLSLSWLLYNFGWLLASFSFTCTFCTRRAIIRIRVPYSSGLLFNHLNSEFYKHNFCYSFRFAPILYGRCWSLQSINLCETVFTRFGVPFYMFCHRKR